MCRSSHRLDALSSAMWMPASSPPLGKIGVMKVRPHVTGGHVFGADLRSPKASLMRFAVQQLASTFTAESLIRYGAGAPRLRQNDAHVVRSQEHVCRHTPLPVGIYLTASRSHESFIKEFVSILTIRGPQKPRGEPFPSAANKSVPCRPSPGPLQGR